MKLEVRRSVRPTGDLVTGVVSLSLSSHLTKYCPPGPSGLVDSSGSASPPSGINNHNIPHNSDLHTPQVGLSDPNISQFFLQFSLHSRVQKQREL